MSINLLLGHTAMGVPVTAANASNPHLYVTGRSGSGKSYFLKGLLAQASTQGALCLVFDYTGDYRTNDFLIEPPLKRVSVASPDFTLNPFWGTTIHSPELLAQQFLSLVHTTFRLGSRASMTLRRSVIDYLRSGTDVPSLQGLAEYMGQLETHSQALDTALDRVELLSSLITCGPKPISLDLSVPGITVLDFRDILDIQLRNLIVSMVLNAVWTHQTSIPVGSALPIVLLLDEAQTLAWGKDSMAKRILCEGRKYNLAGWFAAQWMSNKEAVNALEQSHLRIHFRPDEENVLSLSKRLVQGIPQKHEECVHMLRALQVGQCVLQRPDGRLVKFQSNLIQ